MSNPGQPEIRRGSTGDAVKRAQRALNRAPYQFPGLLAVDGDFGQLTEDRVKDFQGLVSLTVDGIVGVKTWESLPSGAAMPLLQVGSNGGVVYELQETLNGLGSTLSLDARYGPQTKAAVESFQGMHSVPIDGVVGDKTWFVELGSTQDDLENRTGLEYV